MNIEQLAIESGVIHVDGTNTYWTDNNAIEVLDKFANAVIKEQLINEIIKLNIEFIHNDGTSADELVSHLLRHGFEGLKNMTMEELKKELEALK